MKSTALMAAFILCMASVTVAVPALAATKSKTLASAKEEAPATKSYQVTGGVTELTNDKIIIQRGKDKWEMALGPQTKIPDSVKVGSKVAVNYSMTVNGITEVPAKPAKPAAPKPAKPKKK